MNAKPFLHIALLINFLIVITSCHPKEEFDISSTLKFSTDSIFIDTSFTTVTTITRVINIYNNSSLPVLIEKFLGNGSNSMFRFNIDGEPGPVVEDIEIMAHDSLFLFLNATIDLMMRIHLYH